MASEEDTARTRLLDATSADLAAVEVALARLDAGTYFSCEVCETELDAAALADQPTLRRCPACP
jgi:RNA polymerase-binding transcription factor DksA